MEIKKVVYNYFNGTIIENRINVENQHLCDLFFEINVISTPITVYFWEILEFILILSWMFYIMCISFSKEIFEKGGVITCQVLT